MFTKEHEVKIEMEIEGDSSETLTLRGENLSVPAQILSLLQNYVQDVRLVVALPPLVSLIQKCRCKLKKKELGG